MSSLISIALIAGGGALFSILYTVSVQPKGLSLRIGKRAYRQCGVLRALAMIFEAVTLVGYVLFAFTTTLNIRFGAGGSIAVRIAGGVFAVLCLSFMTYATVKGGRESATPSEDTELHHGIYDHMRHPQTLGEMLSWLGISMALDSVTLLVFSVIWIPIFIGFTVVEDNDLALRFGDEYLEYSKRVGLFWKKRHIA